MRLTDLRTVEVDLPSPAGMPTRDSGSLACLLVQVETDAAIGGQALLYTVNPRLLAILTATVEVLRGTAIGEAADHPEALRARLWRVAEPLGPEGVAVMAISAIERACWDVLGKLAGQPLSRLLGGARDDVPVYASGLWLHLDLEELVAAAHAYVADGHRAIKMRIGKPRQQDDVDRVAAVREAVGPDVRLMVDANRHFDVEGAIRLGRRLEAFDLAWIEEPVGAHDLEGSARVAAALDTPIASGEGTFTSRGFRAMLEQRSADILMPDMGRVGGLAEMLRVAHMAAAYDVPVTPHSYPHESVQAVAAIPNGTYVELLPWFDGLYLERLQVADGRLAVPAGPGFGLTIDQAVVERHRRAAPGGQASAVSASRTTSPGSPAAAAPSAR